MSELNINCTFILYEASVVTFQVLHCEVCHVKTCAADTH